MTKYIRKTAIALLAIFLTQTAAFGQGKMESVLDSVERNNTTLKALRQQAVAMKAQNRTATAMPDPEIEFGYLWGSNAGMNPRKDISVTQQLDWATLSGSRSRLAAKDDRLAELGYLRDRQTILAEADNTLTALVHANLLLREYVRREQRAARLSETYQRKYERGDVGLIEVNKTKLDLSAARAATGVARAERDALLGELRRLNGGRPLEFADTAYFSPELPSEAQLAAMIERDNPALLSARAAAERSLAQLKLERTAALPALTVGYTGELIKGDSYNGISVGLSIPLWGSSRKKVKQAQAEVTLAQAQADDTRTQLLATLSSRLASARSLRLAADSLRRDLEQCDNSRLLEKALTKGEISLTVYLTEMSYYYDALDRLLQAELDCQTALSQIRSLIR